MSALPLTNTMLVHLHHQLQSPCNVDACNQPCQVNPDIMDLLATTSTAVATSSWTTPLAPAATSSGVAAASYYISSCRSACLSYCSPYSTSDVSRTWSTRVLLLPDGTTNSDVQSLRDVAATRIGVQYSDVDVLDEVTNIHRGLADEMSLDLRDVRESWRPPLCN